MLADLVVKKLCDDIELVDGPMEVLHVVLLFYLQVRWVAIEERDATMKDVGEFCSMSRTCLMLMQTPMLMAAAAESAALPRTMPLMP